MRAARFLDGRRIDLHDFVVIIPVFGGLKITLTGTIEIFNIRRGKGKNAGHQSQGRTQRRQSGVQ